MKMVHNGIEYGDMQMICEAYHLMRELLDMSAGEIGKSFSNWNEGELDSFLMHISADALQQKDPNNDGFLVDYVMDAAGQKGQVSGHLLTHWIWELLPPLLLRLFLQGA